MAVKNTFFKEVSQAENGSRQGLLKTRRGSVLTPTFMPDGTRGVVKSLSAEQVKATGTDIILANTYHLHLQPGEQTVKSLGGLHAFGKWNGPILTDSGGFQVFSLAALRSVTEEGVTFKDPVTGDSHVLTPELSMQIQFALGSDMFVAFDHLTGLDKESIKDTQAAFERTHRWLERCVKEFRRLSQPLKPSERPLLFGVVQGGIDLELRRRSLELVQATEVDGIAIGGLSVGEPRADMQRVLAHLAPLYDPGRPHFLLGVGEPVDLRFAYEHGIDMADCVLPTRNARHATVWVADNKKIHLTNANYASDPTPIMAGCDCHTCVMGYSKGFLRHQFKVGEPLAGSLASIHNLRYLQRLSEEYRKNPK
jgi:queuine tRNA-ribosyltransferase